MRRSLILCLSVIMVGWVAPTALPCGNAVYAVRSSAIRAMKRAEKRLAKGQLRKAIRGVSSLTLRKVMGKPRRVSGSARARAAQRKNYPKVRDRAKKLLFRRDQLVAMAVLRSKGTLNKKGRKVKKAVDRRIALEDAVAKVLESWGEYKARTPWRAEAQLHTKDRDEGVKTLRDLAQKDLVPGAWTWAALVVVEDKAGNIAARDAALKRCHAVTPRKSICPSFEAEGLRD